LVVDAKNITLILNIEFNCFYFHPTAGQAVPALLPASMALVQLWVFLVLMLNNVDLEHVVPAASSVVAIQLRIQQMCR